MAEIYTPSINREILPEFHSNIFSGHEDSRFAIGQLGKNDDTSLPVEKLAYHRLRAEVYNEQTGMVMHEHIAADGGEYDSDDNRSVHMAVIENLGQDSRIVGTMRLISRGDGNELPIESFFPNEFREQSAPSTSCEVSRYIVRHEDRSAREAISWALFQQGIATAINNQLGPMYATIDPALARIMRFKQVPIQELAPPTRVEKYNSTSLPVVIDVDMFADRLENLAPGVISEMVENKGQFTFFGEKPSPIKIISLGEIALKVAGD